MQSRSSSWQCFSLRLFSCCFQSGRDCFSVLSSVSHPKTVYHIAWTTLHQRKKHTICFVSLSFYSGLLWIIIYPARSAYFLCKTCAFALGSKSQVWGPERYIFPEYSENYRGELQMKITFTQRYSQGMEAQYNRNAAVGLARSVHSTFFRKQLI